MSDWLGRTWNRTREGSVRRAIRASGYEVVAGTIGRAVSGVYGHIASPDPVWEREWDVLCLLDGCRYDLMCEEAATDRHAYLDDEVDTLWSVGSQSAEWMAETFSPEYRDEMAATAYLTGNPFTAQSGDQLAAIDTEPLPLAAEDFGFLYEPWRDEWTDGDISTIPPAPLTDAAIATWRRREELGVDRVIVHYMQPHAPFRSRPEWFLGTADTGGWGRIEDDDGDEDEAHDDLDLEALDEETREFLEALDDDSGEMRDPWTRLRDRELPADAFWGAYRDNLAWVLEDVARLVENCDGRIALSSDHGNAAGEFGVWSHPPGVHLPALRRVPWVTVDGEDRGTETPDLPESVSIDKQPSADVEERLADLGYR